MSGRNPSRVLVTGATGIVGWNVVRALAATAARVRVLARNPAAAARVLDDRTEVVGGDLTDPDSVTRAVTGCDTVFHAAGMPEQWVRDTGVFHRVNVEGTRTLVDAALTASVRCFVYTSTIDVFAHRPGVGYDESVLATEALPTPYERSKQLADQVVTGALGRGLPARFLHPAAIFGPAPTRTPGLNDLLAKLGSGRLPALPPGGVPVVYAPDLAAGHLAAAGAAAGSRFILADRYVSFAELADLVTAATGARRPVQLSRPFAAAASRITEWLARLTHRAPLLPAGQLHFMTAGHRPDATRARTVLQWNPTPLPEAIAATLNARGIPVTAAHQGERS